MGPLPPSPPATLPLDDIASGEYEVEAIFDSRLDCLGAEYLVKWVGYHILILMWESAGHLANAPDILSLFLSHRDRQSSHRGE